MPLDLTTLGLSDEQIKAVNAEIDRARTQASQTAHQNAEKALSEKLPGLIDAAVNKATIEANQTAEEKAAAAWESKFAELNKALETAQNNNVRISNEAKIRKAGITDDNTVTSFADMFVSNPDGLDGFLTTYNNAVNAQVALAKQQAAGNATPPGGNSNPGANVSKSMTQASVSKIIEDNERSNGGYIDDAQLFADIRSMQTQA